MQCDVEERVVRGTRREVVRCFKYRKEGHKCRECLLWEKKVKRVARPDEGKAHQKEKRKEVRQVKEGKAARPVKGKAARPVKGKAQQELRRQRGPERQRRSRAAHGQENRNAQQERGVVERRSGEPSKC